MQPADTVREIRCPQREGGHVELPVILAKCKETTAVIVDRSPCALEMVLDPIEWKRIVAGGNGRVRREDGRLAYRGQRVFEAHAFGDELVDPLKDDK